MFIYQRTVFTRILRNLGLLSDRYVRVEMSSSASHTLGGASVIGVVLNLISVSGNDAHRLHHNRLLVPGLAVASYSLAAISHRLLTVVERPLHLVSHGNRWQQSLISSL